MLFVESFLGVIKPISTIVLPPLDRKPPPSVPLSTPRRAPSKASFQLGEALRPESLMGAAVNSVFQPCSLANFLVAEMTAWRTLSLLLCRSGRPVPLIRDVYSSPFELLCQLLEVALYSLPSLRKDFIVVVPPRKLGLLA